MGADPSDAYKADVANYLKALGRNVRTLRKQVSPRLSQERLADITGLHRTEIGKLEQGRVDPRLMTLHRVAHALNATLDDLTKGLPIPPHRDLWGHYERGKSTPTVDSDPQTDGRQSRKEQVKGDL
jgi:transcriptional regulator with XRE-family HTH domain